MTAGEEQAVPGPTTTAIVGEALTNGLFRLQTQDGRVLTAHVAKEFRMAFARLLPGDPVQVDVSPFDPNKARICKLLDRQ